MSSKISILGCGWLGIPLGTHLSKKGYTVSGTTTRPEKMKLLERSDIIPYQWKLGDSLPAELLKSEVIIISITSKEIDLFKPLVKELQVAKSAHVVYISSTAVYDANNARVNEETPVNKHPMASIEELFCTSDVPSTIIRFAGLFGGDRKPGNFFKNKPSIPNPNGVVNMIHLDDCIGVIEAIIEQDQRAEIYNACAPHHPTRKEFYTKAAEAVGKETPLFDSATKPWKEIDSSKLINELNYKFIHPDLLVALVQ